MYQHYFLRVAVVGLFLSLFVAVHGANDVETRQLIKGSLSGTQKQGFITSFDGERIATSVDLYDGERLIAQFRKKVFSPDVVQRLTPIFEKIVRDNSGRERSMPGRNDAYQKDTNLNIGFKTKLGNMATQFNAWNNISSDILGSFVVSFLQEISDYFAKISPFWHSKHEAILKKNDGAFRIGQSAFSTFSLNLGTPGHGTDAQTFFHKDTGHAEHGVEVLAFLGEAIEGGELVFPEYNVALVLEAGDVAVMRGYEVLHGNTPLKSGKKLTVLAHILAGHDQKLSVETIKKVTSS